MTLCYLVKQEVVFLEDTYWEKGNRIGNLIYNPIDAEYQFWAERGAGISVSSLHQIVYKIDEMNRTRPN